jgi:hypothetical protein
MTPTTDVAVGKAVAGAHVGTAAAEPTAHRVRWTRRLLRNRSVVVGATIFLVFLAAALFFHILSFLEMWLTLWLLTRFQNLLLQLHRQRSRTGGIKDHHVLSGHGELESTSLRTHRQIQQDGQEKKHLPGQQAQETFEPFEAYLGC